MGKRLFIAVLMSVFLTLSYLGAAFAEGGDGSGGGNSDGAKGLADAGIGVKSAALRLGLDFIPLYIERYDLVFLGRITKTTVWRQFLSILTSPGFTNAVRQQGGYDTTMTGQILLDA